MENVEKKEGTGNKGCKIRILHYSLKKKWFDMELSGEKTEEYREGTSYWQNRLLHKKYDIVQARNGYSKNAPMFRRKCIDIIIGIGNPEWGAPDYPVFIIKLGEIIK
jgi:hypothetical protein